MTVFTAAPLSIFFAKSHAQFHWYKTDKDLKGARLPAAKDTTFVMVSDNCDVSKGWRDVLRSQCKKPKFILLSPDRGDRLGFLEPDSYQIQASSILISQIHKALATLNGVAPLAAPPVAQQKRARGVLRGKNAPRGLNRVGRRG